MQSKAALRKQLRQARHEHVASLPASMCGLLFRHPPKPLLELIRHEAVIGLYAATPDEAPTRSYAGYFFERGHTLALPRLAQRKAMMEFAHHSDPHGESDLEIGPFGLRQPGAAAARLVPDILFVPLVGFTARGERLGQGAGHYDRWLAEHPATLRIGLAWDCQLVDTLPAEAHDAMLNAVVTPTRLYGPF